MLLNALWHVAFSVVDVQNLEEDLREMEAAIEKEKEEHQELMKQKEKEYDETEKQLTADNQAICTIRSQPCFIVSYRFLHVPLNNSEILSFTWLIQKYFSW